MRVFIAIREPFHDNSTILGVFSSPAPAEAMIVEAAKQYVADAEGQPADCELWQVEEWESDGNLIDTTAYNFCRSDYFERRGKAFGTPMPGLPFILVKSDSHEQAAEA